MAPGAAEEMSEPLIPGKPPSGVDTRPRSNNCTSRGLVLGDHGSALRLHRLHPRRSHPYRSLWGRRQSCGLARSSPPTWTADSARPLRLPSQQTAFPLEDGRQEIQEPTTPVLHECRQESGSRPERRKGPPAMPGSRPRTQQWHQIIRTS